MRLFGSDRIARWMDKSGAEEGEVITGGLVTRAIEQAQKRVELQNFESRKRLLEYDDVMNQQREVIYSLRLFALERGEELKAEARRMIEAALERAVTQFLANVEHAEEWDRGGLRESLMLQYLVTVDALTDAEATPSIDKMVERTKAEGEETFRRKIEYLAEFGRSIGIPDVDSQVLSQVMLTVLDERWKDHLYDLDQLRNAIQYRAWGQKDPLVEYKREAFEMFQDLMHDIQSTFTERFFKIQVSAERPEPPRAAPPPPPPTAAVHPSAPTSGADDLFMGPPPRVGPPPVAPGGAGARADQLAWATRSGDGGGAGGGAERSVSVRVGEEVQEVPRGGAVARRPPEAMCGRRPSVDRCSGGPHRVRHSDVVVRTEVSMAHVSLGDRPGAGRRVQLLGGREAGGGSRWGHRHDRVGDAGRRRAPSVERHDRPKDRRRQPRHRSNLPVHPPGHRVRLRGDRRLGRVRPFDGSLEVSDRRDPPAVVRAASARGRERRVPAVAGQGAEARDVQGDPVPGGRLGGREGVRGQEIA